jgi:hypothetical protein
MHNVFPMCLNSEAAVINVRESLSQTLPIFQIETVIESVVSPSSIYKNYI